MPNHRLKMAEGWAMPAGNPYFQLPCYYRGTRTQSIYFLADLGAVYDFLPEPLEPAASGLCGVITVHAPFTSSYGEFSVSYLLLHATFQGQLVFYIPHLFENNPSAMCAGREIWGTPKVFAEVTLEERHQTLIGRTLVNGVPLIETASVSGAPCDPAEVPTAPVLRLKIIPRADRPEAAIKQLVTGGNTDQVIHSLAKGNGSVHFGTTDLADLAGLQPREIVGTYDQLSDHTETFGEIVFDYLNPAARRPGPSSGRGLY
jgi:acetoacetate decarboxylase